MTDQKLTSPESGRVSAAPPFPTAEAPLHPRVTLDGSPESMAALDEALNRAYRECGKVREWSDQCISAWRKTDLQRRCYLMKFAGLDWAHIGMYSELEFEAIPYQSRKKMEGVFRNLSEFVWEMFDDDRGREPGNLGAVS